MIVRYLQVLLVSIESEYIYTPIAQMKIFIVVGLIFYTTHKAASILVVTSSI